MILDNSMQIVKQWSDGPRVYFTLDHWDLRIYTLYLRGTLRVWFIYKKIVTETQVIYSNATLVILLCITALKDT